jgi:broad specificity phosphatase PhoE
MAAMNQGNGVRVHKPRIIIMRHSERLDSALRNNQWPYEVYRNGVYTPNVTQMPTALPTRADPLEYSLDTPLSRHGKSHAYHTGEFFRSVSLIPHRVYTSPAMRCVETADSVLAGIGVRQHAPLRLDLALHEPAKRKLPIQSAEFYSSAGYIVDVSYRPTLAPANNHIIVKETRMDYYKRMYYVLKRITNKLISENLHASASSTPPTVLVVTHRPCVPLLAAMLNLDLVDDKLNYLNNMLSRKQDEVNFLAMIIAEYDSATGLWTFLSEFPRVSPAASLYTRNYRN